MSHPPAGAKPASLPLPSTASWDRFIDTLRLAREVQTGQAPETPGGNDLPRDRASVQLAIGAVVELLAEHPSALAEKLPGVFGPLAVALSDLANGKQSELLTARRTTKPNKGIVYELIMLHAALAVEELVEAKESLGNAAAKVARTIKAAKLPVRPRGDASLVSTVLGWRNRFHERHESITDGTHEDWRADREGGKARHGATPTERAKRHLDLLRHWPVLQGNF